MKMEELVERLVNVHPPDRCAGEYCTIHNPSDHPMRDWDVLIRESALIERLCGHGVGHPDPDSAAALDKLYGFTAWGTHGCDGCCALPEVEPAHPLGIPR